MALGDINLLDDDEIDAQAAFAHWPCACSTTLVAVAYHAWLPGTYNKIVVRTYNVDVGGTLSTTGYSLDLWNTDDLPAAPCMLKLSANGNMYALVAETSGGGCRLAILEILGDGSIAVVADYTFVTTATKPRIIELFDNLFAILYKNTSGTGTMITVRIDPTYFTVLPTSETATISDFKCHGDMYWLVNDDGRFLFVVYRTTADTGKIASFSFSAFGSIAATAFTLQIDSGDAEAANFGGGSIVMCDDPRAIVVYSKANAYTADKCTGGTVTYSTQNSPTYTAAKAFDDSTATSWCSTAGPPMWIAYQFAAAAKWCIVKYSITNGNTSANYDPKTWQFQGSDDGVVWYTLDSQAGVTWASRLLTKEYTFCNSRRFNYYRLYITAIGSGAICEITEVSMYAQSDVKGRTKLVTLAGDDGEMLYSGTHLDWATDLLSDQPGHAAHYGVNMAANYIIGIPYIDTSVIGQVVSIMLSDSNALSSVDKDAFYPTIVLEACRLIRLTGESGGGGVPSGDKFWEIFRLSLPFPSVSYTFEIFDEGSQNAPIVLSIPVPTVEHDEVEEHSGGAQTAADALTVVVPTLNDYAMLVREKYQSGDDGDGLIYGNNWEGQTFTPAANHNLNYVTIKVKKVGTVVGNVITVAIYATDGGGLPTGAALLTATLDFNGLPDINTVMPVVFSSSTALTASTKYALVLYGSGGDIANYLAWRKDASSPSYAGGSRVYSANAGSSWSADTGTDYIFDEGEAIS